MAGAVGLSPLDLERGACADVVVRLSEHSAKGTGDEAAISGPLMSQSSLRDSMDRHEVDGAGPVPATGWSRFRSPAAMWQQLVAEFVLLGEQVGRATCGNAHTTHSCQGVYVAVGKSAAPESGKVHRR